MGMGKAFNMNGGVVSATLCQNNHYQLCWINLGKIVCWLLVTPAVAPVTFP